MKINRKKEKVKTTVSKTIVTVAKPLSKTARGDLNGFG